jgi:hypothetical protein
VRQEREREHRQLQVKSNIIRLSCSHAYVFISLALLYNYTVCITVYSCSQILMRVSCNNARVRRLIKNERTSSGNIPSTEICLDLNLYYLCITRMKDMTIQGSNVTALNALLPVTDLGPTRCALYTLTYAHTSHTQILAHIATQTQM